VAEEGEVGRNSKQEAPSFKAQLPLTELGSMHPQARSGALWDPAGSEWEGAAAL
jgi:hypothetical protein